MTRLSGLLAILALGLALSPAQAQVDRAGEALAALYRLSATIDACEVDIDADADGRLDDAILAAEQSSSLDEAALDDLYARTEIALEQDLANGGATACERAASEAKAAIAALPR